MISDNRVRATVIGLSAVLMWATLGLFGAGSGKVPPFLLNALCFGISGILALILVTATGKTGAAQAAAENLGIWHFGPVRLSFFLFHSHPGMRLPLMPI